jgi:hypothetical protein
MFNIREIFWVILVVDTFNLQLNPFLTTIESRMKAW